MGRLGDSSTRLALPLDASLGPVVVGPLRSYLRLYHLPRSASEFILDRMQRAVRRLAARVSPRSPRVRLTLRIRAGQLRVVLRVFCAGPWDLRLAPLTRGAPSTVKAEYRSGSRGGTLTFTSSLKRED